MKKQFALLILSFALLKCGYPQNTYLHDANQQLREIFKFITYPNNNIKYLYERSGKLSDSTFYSNHCADTIETSMWMQLYEEMFYAAHDTSGLLRLQEITDYGNSFYHDTVPIAIMDLDYYYLKPDALTSGTYFIFDTINNHLSDNPNRPSTPFLIGNIFAAAPTVTDANFSNVVFRIDPALIFKDINNSTYYNDSLNLKIDFGDGSGWHSVNPLFVNHFNITYPTNGNKHINVAIFAKNSNRPIKSSFSSFSVVRPNPAIWPDNQPTFDGLDVGIYNSCNSDPRDNPDYKKKIIIYLEGIDILDCFPSKARNVPEIYEEMIHKESISMN